MHARESVAYPGGLVARKPPSAMFFLYLPHTYLKQVKNTVDQQHHAWFQEIELMCRPVDVVRSIPRRYARQRHRNNVPADYPLTYYRRCISVSLVDHQLVELETRFSPHHRVALLWLCLVPSALVTLHDQ